MNILNEVTIDFDLDSKILNDTPAKLKLREKTLNGIYTNLNEETCTLPGLMLAKKKKKNIEKKEEIVPEVKERDYVGTIIENSEAVATDEYMTTRKLKLSEEKRKNVTENIQKFMDIPVIEEPTIEPNVVEEPTIEAVEVNEIPEMNNVEPQATIETPEEIKTTDVVVEEPEFNVYQGQTGEISNVEEIKLPEVEETKEEMPTIETPVNNIKNGLDRANSEDIYKENSKLIQELNDLKSEEAKTLNILEQCKQDYKLELDKSSELDRTYAEKQQKAEELQRQFFDAVENQKNLLMENKKQTKERQKQHEQEIQEVNAKTNEVKSKNEVKKEKIQKTDDKIMQYQQLIQSMQGIENFDEEKTYSKAM